MQTAKAKMIKLHTLVLRKNMNVHSHFNYSSWEFHVLPFALSNEIKRCVNLKYFLQLNCNICLLLSLTADQTVVMMGFN